MINGKTNSIIAKQMTMMPSLSLPGRRIIEIMKYTDPAAHAMKNFLSMLILFIFFFLLFIHEIQAEE
jgi:hypothetical protein